MNGITGVNHIAVNTADLDRFRRFYEGVLGLDTALVGRLTHDPFLRHGVLETGGGPVLHVFEVPGYDPAAEGIPDEIGRRGRVDHFAFVVADEPALEEVAARLRAAGASDGEVRSFGPVLSVHFQDPDGLHLEVTCPEPGWVPEPGELEEEPGGRAWFDRMVLQSAGG